MPPRKKGLSNLDIFGLTSGIIGLIADVISLSALFGLTQASISIPFSSWVTTLILIIYTGIITGFYARRILCHINQKKLKRVGLGPDDYTRIEHSSTVITCLVAATLCVMFLYSVVSAVVQSEERDYQEDVRVLNKRFDDAKTAAKPGEIEGLDEARSTEIYRLQQGKSSSIFFSGFMIILFGGMGSAGLTILINYISKMIYIGCDPVYRRS